VDFYRRQAAARSQTRGLLIGFLLALAAVVTALTLVLLSLLSSASVGTIYIAPLEFASLNPRIALFCGLFSLALVVLPSCYKALQLRSGGGVVARSLGGVRLEQVPIEPKLKRLRNVVEEMALAANIAVPEVYILEQEASINAFAAGHTPANAAIGVTQGALEQLTREQLQGVIAHEFSHIVNGDMRLNIQLMGWLFGLFVISILGRTLLELTSRTTRKGDNALAVVGLLILGVGYCGLLAGRLLQAAVSRQRERLADASAVQFTRNPTGLKEALVKIAQLTEGSYLKSAAVESSAHLLFAAGMKRWFNTHPPLLQRVQALDPEFPPADLLAYKPVPQSQEKSHLTPAPTAHSPQEAEALVLAVVLSHEPAVNERQWICLAKALEPVELSAVKQYFKWCAELAAPERLPAVLRLFPILRRLTRARRQRLLALVDELVMADGRLELFEFCLIRLLGTLLTDELSARAPHGQLNLSQLKTEQDILFSVLAGRRDADWSARLTRALDRFEKLAAPAKQQLIAELTSAIVQDDKVSTAEAELLRTLCAILHCPAPSLQKFTDDTAKALEVN
jgi:Zn-dependent protease with chaperone function